MRKLIAMAATVAACLVIDGSGTAIPYHIQKSSPAPFGVLCCCQTSRGGSCCADVAFCGSFIPGCICR